MDLEPFRFEDWEMALREVLPPKLQLGYREAIGKFRYWLRQTGKQPNVETFKAHLEWKRSYLSPERFEIRRDALRWYFQEGRRRMKAALLEKVTPIPAPPTQVSSYPNAGSVPSKPTDGQTGDRRPHLPSAQESVAPGKPRPRTSGGYRVYAMNDVPSAGARDLGGPPWEKALVCRIREKHLAWTSEKTYRGWCRRFLASCGGKPINSLDHGDVRKRCMGTGK